MYLSKLVVLIVVLSTLDDVHSWSTHQPSSRRLPPCVHTFRKRRGGRGFSAVGRVVMALSKNHKETQQEEQVVQEQEQQQPPPDLLQVNPQATLYGVSFMGGDPCGSKYNDDPFGAGDVKPGIPDDMKARIAALAEQRKRQQEGSQS